MRHKSIIIGLRHNQLSHSWSFPTHAHNILKRKLAAYILKCFHFYGRMAKPLTRWPPTRGFAPGPHWRHTPRCWQIVIGSHSRARHERQRSGSFFDPCTCATESLLTVIPYSKQFVAIICVFFEAKNYQKRFWPVLCLDSTEERTLGSLRRSPDLTIGKSGEPLPISLPLTPLAPR